MDNFRNLSVAQNPTPMTCRDIEPGSQHLSDWVNYLRVTEYMLIETTIFYNLNGQVPVDK